MKDHNQLDDFLKRKLSHREIKFKEAYWEAAEQLIIADQQKRRKKRFFLFFLTGLLGLALSGSLIYFLSSPADTDSLPIEIAQPSVVSSSAQPESLNTDSLQPTTHPSDLPQRQAKADSASSSFSPSQVEPAPAASPGQNSPDITTSLSPGETTVPPGTAEPIRAAFDTPQPEVVQPAADPLANALPQQQTRIGLISKVQTQAFQLQSVIQDVIIYLPVPTATTTRRNHFLGLVAGSTMSPGLFNTQPDRADFSTHPMLGLRYTYVPDPRLRIHSGIRYQGRAGLNSDATFESVAFGFGATQETTTLVPKRLHYLEIPLYLDYRIAGKHYAGIGVTGAYLLNVSSRLNTVVSNEFGTLDQASQRAWGYTQGFNRLDAGLMAGYSYYIGKGISIGVRGNIGLTDLTDDRFFNNQTKDRSHQIRLILEYDLFRF